MSKYQQRGAYHYAEFANDTPYRKHVLDLLDQIGKLLPSGNTILDVGSGEGLITDQLCKRGYIAQGCDVDPAAVGLADQAGNKVVCEKIDFFAGLEFDAVLICDVLEHVDDFKGTIEAAQMLAPLVVIAIPDRRDANAVRQPTLDDVVQCFKGWELLHTSQRHARWLMIFKDHSGD